MILDQQSVDKLKQRNEAIFEAIYAQTKRGVYAIIFSIIQDHASSEDIMQDVYMKMLVKIDHYKVGTNFANWLLQIAKNQAIDVYRQQKKHVSVSDDVIHLAEISKEETPEEQDLLIRMLDLLDETEKIIVLLKTVDEKSHQDIAKIVHKPLGTVLWLYHRALRKIRDYMGDV
jgi:RNA polymerase sigma-70 factor (ECF subfamily)